ncbi:MAG: DUF3040 domain-containing protein [Actinomycetales bacterium]|nr:DUF3040 domain-containing protein [Actinomycetales bacterium]
MPLSDREQHLLEQMERALYAEDPRFATTISKTGAPGPARGQRRWLLLGALLALAGVVLVIMSIVVRFMPLGILGFIAMVAGAALAFEGGRHPAGLPGPAAESGQPGRGPATPSRSGFVQRMEDRWQRRNEGDAPSE